MRTVFTSFLRARILAWTRRAPPHERRAPETGSTAPSQCATRLQGSFKSIAESLRIAVRRDAAQAGCPELFPLVPI